MDKGNLNIKVGIIFKDITLKIKKEVRENIILIKGGFYNRSSIQILHRYQKYIYQMVQFMLENKKMDQERVQEKLSMLMVVFMMVNG
jgi:hypothetical protein